MKYKLTHYKVHGWAVRVKKWYGWMNVKTFSFSRVSEALALFELLNKR